MSEGWRSWGLLGVPNPKARAIEGRRQGRGINYALRAQLCHPGHPLAPPLFGPTVNTNISTIFKKPSRLNFCPKQKTRWLVDFEVKKTCYPKVLQYVC